ncbi:MAG TPA: phosphatidylglycerophosphatase A, partial [Steroidobacteraceae bacterium]|nr:phosphatidylglycerophosphatase A [Steroidobacteraceae bacterium]
NESLFVVVAGKPSTSSGAAMIILRERMKFSADPKIIFRDPIHILAFGFGAGLSPRAPGTMGTLIAVPLIMFIGSFGWIAHAIFAAIICVSGVYICGISATKLGVHDHPGIVWDEIAGFAVGMLTVPLTFKSLLVGFVLFRCFDIFKPWPIREADHSLKGGLGIMLDDVIAGVFTGVVLYALNSWL